MKRYPLLILVFSFLWMSCKDKNPETDTSTAEKTLVANPWKMVSITNLDGTAVPENQLNSQTREIFKMNIQFQANKVVKAFDDAQQASNGGTWELVQDSKILDIKIIGFTGQFGVSQLSVSKMSLVNKVPVNGKEVQVNMNFQPVIK